MSSMLEQAIIDAGALKEAAVKNAEAEILEKYSQEIKEAVSTLLEQTEEEGLLDAELPPSMEEETQVDEQFLNQVPGSAISGEDVAGQPHDNELVEIDFTELVADDASAGSTALGAVGSFVGGELGSAIGGSPGAALGSAAGETLAGQLTGDEIELAEVVNISEDDLADLVEELVFGAEGPAPNGYLSSNTSEVEEAQEIERVRREIEEKNSKNEDLKEELNQYKQQSNKFRRIILELKDKLDEVSLENARFLYTNRVLKNASLNERQKNKLVETISSAKTIEEAKVIFETLQSAVESSSRKGKPKSLDEAIERRSSRLYHSREQNNISDPVVERMQRLAGISKN